jgi:hypothetical protein
MKNFFHLTISVILGSLLGYGLYYKILNKPMASKADDIQVEDLFFADHAAFEKKKQEALTLARPMYTDTLQVSPRFFETTVPAKNIAATVAKPTESKPIKVIEAVRLIEVAQIQKPKAIAIPVTKIATPEKQEAVYASTATIAKEAPATEATENDADTQVQEERKKKFLFFNRKDKND